MVWGPITRTLSGAIWHLLECINLTGLTCILYVSESASKFVVLETWHPGYCVTGCAMAKKSYRDGNHYRERAEECRVLAEILVTSELRAKMLNVASDYEQMADSADKLADEPSGESGLQALR
jgi:hypothetical protein